MPFGNIYKEKKIFVTGHTGFKGSWLCAWLLELGAKVCGYSIDVPTKPSHFEILGLGDSIKHVQGDILDKEKLSNTLQYFEPDMVFHLAAQPLVRRSYENPVLTFETNTIGTLNVLEGIRHIPSVRVGVIITSDKCYRNQEWGWGYRESDLLGGKDPYSASKGCAELIIYSYIQSFFKHEPNVCSTRAGNVIGGGDWAEDRIVPDAVRAWSVGKKLVIRSPEATRPWQHVLEPLSGYLWLGTKLWQGDTGAVGEAFNFGPQAGVNQSVGELIEALAEKWPTSMWEVAGSAEEKAKESTLLKLSCDKALDRLKWQATLDFKETVKFTREWYQEYYNKDASDMIQVTNSQIAEFVNLAKERGQMWVTG